MNIIEQSEYHNSKQILNKQIDDLIDTYNLVERFNDSDKYALGMIWENYIKLQLTGERIKLNDEDVSSAQFYDALSKICEKYYGVLPISMYYIIAFESNVQPKFIKEFIQLTNQRIKQLEQLKDKYYNKIDKLNKEINVREPQENQIPDLANYEPYSIEWKNLMQPFYLSQTNKIRQAETLIEEINKLFYEFKLILNLRLKVLKSDAKIFDKMFKYIEV